MDINRAFFDITSRVQNTLIKKAFRRFTHLSAGTSAEKTRDKVAELVKKGNPKDLEALRGIVDWYLEDYFFHGEKAVQFYELDLQTIDQLIKKVGETSIASGAAAEHYPLAVDTEYSDTSNPEVVKVEYIDGCVVIVFSTVRYYTERVKIRPKQLQEDYQEEYSDVKEFVGDRKKFRQFFDLAVIRPEGFIELRIDNPRLDKSKQMPVEERRKAFFEIQIAFNKVAEKLTDKRRILPAPINLIHAVDIIYASAEEGTVKQVNFSTANDSAKKIVASKSDENACCRQDLFTKAGTKAVTENNEEISPYRIYVVWQRFEKHFPELQILGTFYNLDVTKNPINEAILTKCLTKSDFDFIRDKVLVNRSYDESVSPQSCVA